MDIDTRAMKSIEILNFRRIGARGAVSYDEEARPNSVSQPSGIF